MYSRETPGCSFLQPLAHPLPHYRLELELRHLPGWRHDRGVLHKSFQFTSVLRALSFGSELDKLRDIPRETAPWMVLGNQVLVHLSTREIGNQVGAADLEFAYAVEQAHASFEDAATITGAHRFMD